MSWRTSSSNTPPSAALSAPTTGNRRSVGCCLKASTAAAIGWSTATGLDRGEQLGDARLHRADLAARDDPPVRTSQLAELDGRPRDVKALCHVAAEVARHAEVGGVFDAFGDRAEAERVREPAQLGDDRLLADVGGDLGDEELVDLDVVRLELEQHVQARVADPEIVDRDPAPWSLSTSVTCRRLSNEVTGCCSEISMHKLAGGMPELPIRSISASWLSGEPS